MLSMKEYWPATESVSETSTHSINDDWYSSEFWPLNNLLKQNMPNINEFKPT